MWESNIMVFYKELGYGLYWNKWMGDFNEGFSWKLTTILISWLNFTFQKRNLYSAKGMINFFYLTEQ